MGGLSLSSINQEKNLFIANKEPTALTKESKWIQQINQQLIGDQNTRLLIQAIKNSLNFIKGKTAKSHLHTHTQPRPLHLWACMQTVNSRLVPLTYVKTIYIKISFIHALWWSVSLYEWGTNTTKQREN